MIDITKMIVVVGTFFFVAMAALWSIVFKFVLWNKQSDLDMENENESNSGSFEDKSNEP